LVQILPAKSGLLRSMPVSRTATIVEGFPSVTPQASGASMSTLFELFRPQSWPKAGSLGRFVTAVAWIIESAVA
jgi:hypothetical protein